MSAGPVTTTSFTSALPQQQTGITGRHTPWGMSAPQCAPAKHKIVVKINPWHTNRSRMMTLLLMLSMWAAHTHTHTPTHNFEQAFKARGSLRRDFAERMKFPALKILQPTQHARGKLDCLSIPAEYCTQRPESLSAKHTATCLRPISTNLRYVSVTRDPGRSHAVPNIDTSASHSAKISENARQISGNRWLVI